MDLNTKITLLDGEEFRELEINKNYLISNYGRIYSIISNKLLIFNKTHGKNRVKLYNTNLYRHKSTNTYYVDILVFTTFVGELENDKYLIHIDKDNFNDKIENLNVETKINLIGKKFGNLIPLKLKSDSRKSYICRCELCGNTDVIAFESRLISGKKIHCGCGFKSHEKGNNNPNFKGYEEISGSFYNRFKLNAQYRNIEFSITIKYLWDLFLKQNKKCALSKINLKFPLTVKFKDGNISLDRIDSSKGYVEGNVQWVHKDINYMKQDLDQNQFINYCKLISQNN